MKNVLKLFLLSDLTGLDRSSIDPPIPYYEPSGFNVRYYFYNCVQYEVLLENYCNSLLVVELFTYCKKYLAEWNLVIYLGIRKNH